MGRHNLWLVKPNECKIICYGDRSEMNDIAILAGIQGEVHVLPDPEEPRQFATANTLHGGTP